MIVRSQGKTIELKIITEEYLQESNFYSSFYSFRFNIMV